MSDIEQAMWANGNLKRGGCAWNGYEELDKREKVTLMHHHTSMGDVKSAKAVWDAAGDDERDVAMVTARIALVEAVDEAVVLLEGCYRRGYALDERAYVEALKVCRRSGDIQGVFQLLQLMDEYGHPEGKRTKFYPLALSIARQAAVADPDYPQLPAKFRHLWKRMLRDRAGSAFAATEYVYVVMDLLAAGLKADDLAVCTSELWAEYQLLVSKLTPRPDRTLHELLLQGIKLAVQLRRRDISAGLVATLEQLFPVRNKPKEDWGATRRQPEYRAIRRAPSVEHAMALVAQLLPGADAARPSQPGPTQDWARAVLDSDQSRRAGSPRRITDASLLEALRLCRRHRDISNALKLLSWIEADRPGPTAAHYSTALHIAQHEGIRDPTCSAFVTIWRRMIERRRISPDAVFEYMMLYYASFRADAATAAVRAVLTPELFPHIGSGGLVTPRLLRATAVLCQRLKKQNLWEAVRSIYAAHFPHLQPLQRAHVGSREAAGIKGEWGILAAAAAVQKAPLAQQALPNHAVPW